MSDKTLREQVDDLEARVSELEELVRQLLSKEKEPSEQAQKVVDGHLTLTDEQVIIRGEKVILR